MLKLRFKDNKHNAVWLVEPKVTIGRAIDNDVVLEDPGVGEHHAEILVKHEHLTLVNLGEQPLRVNNRIVEKNTELKVKDLVSIGKVDLEVIDPKMEARPAVSETTGWALKANHAALANRVYPINTETVIGRSRECDISLAAAHLSRRHVKLFVQEGLLYLRDLGSANGTYLNGERVMEARVRRGDELRFDTLSFGVIGPPSEDLDKTTVRALTPAAVVPPSSAQPVASAGATQIQRSKAAPLSQPVRQPLGSAVQLKQEQTKHEEPLLAEVPAAAQRASRHGALRWGGLLLLGLGVAVGVAWQQGLLGI